MEGLKFLEMSVGENAKNKKIIYGMVFLLAVGVAVFLWNSYQIEIRERPAKPIKLPWANWGKCGIEQCHGLDITCGSNIPEMCTMEASIDDFCREYVRCEKVGRECRLIKEPKFEECKSCIEKCNQEEDPEKAFQCASGCVSGTNESNLIPEIPPAKVVFNDQIFVPAKCVLSSSSRVIGIGRTVEGYSVYQEETGKNEGILLKRKDGNYQCFIKGADYVRGSISVVFKASTYDQAVSLLESYNFKYQLNNDRLPDSPLFFSVEVPLGKEKEWIDDFKKEQIVLDADFNYIMKAE